MAEEKTIGQLLKEYRLNRGKTQREFTSGIISTSFYSKVEKNLSRISAEDLIKILACNDIELWDFFSSLGAVNNDKYQIELDSEMKNAWYHNNRDKLINIKKKIEASNWKNKDEKVLIVDGWIEAMKDGDEQPNLEIREALKEKIFNISSINKNKMILFCNSMEFYDFESNLIISKQIIEKFRGSKDIAIQEALLGIIANMLYLIIIKDKYAYAEMFLDYANNISTTPSLFFLKNCIFFYANLINYHLRKDRTCISNCKMAIRTFKNLGMKEYGESSEQVLKNMIN